MILFLYIFINFDKIIKITGKLIPILIKVNLNLYLFRFSNLEILAKMEQEMATRMEKEGLNPGEEMEGDENMEACIQGT